MERIFYALSLAEPAAVTMLLLAAACLLARRHRIQRRWLNRSVRALGFLLFIPALASVLYLSLQIESAYPPRAFPSPDGKYVADYEYNGNFMGGSSSVTLRRSRSMSRANIFYTEDSDGWDDVDVHWLNNRELQVTYRIDGDTFSYCSPDAMEIAVKCIDQSQPGNKK